MSLLLARSPAEGLLPLTRGTVTLSERMPEAITSIAPFRGRQAEVSAALGETGLAFPAPGTSQTAGGATIQWTGRDQAFLLGPAPGPVPGAALTDQSDGWAVLVLEGADAEAVLARLVPLDLRASAFPEGAAARSMLFHMPLALRRSGPQVFELMVFRSMVASAVHDLDRAMTSVAAQSA